MSPSTTAAQRGTATARRRRSRLAALLLALLTPVWLAAVVWPGLTAGVGDAAPAVVASAAFEDVIVYLYGAADLTTVSASAGPIDRRRAVVAALQSTAVAAQAPLLAALDQGIAAGDVQAVQPLWIVNAVAVRATPATIAALAARPDVARVSPDHPRQYIPTLDTSVAADDSPPLPWGQARVHSEYARLGLGLTGAGVTVAIMDTGVDWSHPDLAANYRGAGGDHASAWVDFVDGSATPIDPHGHGSHVAGTAVGASGLGVAPGAEWVGVRVFSANGSAAESTIHLGFQWLLAPHGDPALAPDIVNNSWTAPPDADAFLPDVAALEAAGIIAVFAAGNAGPGAGTVGAPANYAGALAVGAAEDRDIPAWFSARGPSVLTDELKPVLLAPGTHTLSARPGGGYRYLNGTSMAAPHVAGTVALLLEADPSLTTAEATAVLTATAVDISPAGPDADSGWGRLDAYAAATAALTAADQTGVGAWQLVVTDKLTEKPIAATVTVTTPSGPLTFTTNLQGEVHAPLAPGVYTATARAFGYQAAPDLTVVIAGGVSVVTPVALLPAARYPVDGRLTTAAGEPLAGSVMVAGAAVEVATGSDGRFTLHLPVGRHRLRLTAPGRRVAHRTVDMNSGGAPPLVAAIDTAPSLLLVDSAVAYDSSAAAYLAALDQAGYAADIWLMRDPVHDIPPAALLSSYDAVIWAEPSRSPGDTAAGAAIDDFLDAGGRLFIAGPNIADRDADRHPPAHWWPDHVDAAWLGKAAEPLTVTGAADAPWAGLQFGLDPPTSLAPHAPDRVAIAPTADEQPLAHYTDGSVAALLTGPCVSGQALYVGFGLERVSDPVARAALLGAGVAALTGSPAPVGARFTPAAVADFALPGEAAYLLVLRNESAGHDDTFSLSLVDAPWPATLSSETVGLGSCQSTALLLTVDVPTGLPRATDYRFAVTAVSSLDPTYSQTLPIHLWSPGHLLFVDDDRFYDREDQLTGALAGAGVRADLWEVGWEPRLRGSPPADLLALYDMVVWYTGYDWFMPLTQEELATLAGYLEGGGRLLLTSQDFLDEHHHASAFSRDYLGVLDYAPSVTPTAVYAGRAAPLLADLAGPLALSFPPYLNHGDALRPAPGATALAWHDGGIAAVTRRGDGWRTMFWGVPLEQLPATDLATLLPRLVSWLGDLGEARFEVVQTAVGGRVRLAYSLTLPNSGPAATRVTVTNTLPAGVTLDPASLTGGAIVDSAGRVRWSGDVAGGAQHRITYQVTVQGGMSRLVNAAAIHYARHDLQFERVAVTWLGGPDLTASRLWVEPGAPRPGAPLTLSLRLQNDGGAGGPVTATLRLPPPLAPLSGTATANLGDVALTADTLLWTGRMAPQMPATVTVQAMTRAGLEGPLAEAAGFAGLTAVVVNGRQETFVLYAETPFAPWRAYTPYFPIKRPLNAPLADN